MEAMTAKEVAALVRATSVLDNDAMQATSNALYDRISAREAIGECAALDDAVFKVLCQLQDMARQLVNAMEQEAAERTAVASYLRRPGQILTLSLGARLTRQSDHTAAHLVGLYGERADHLTAMLRLYEVAGDLVRSTPEERAAVLAERERKTREKAEREAAPRPLKKGRRR